MNAFLTKIFGASWRTTLFGIIAGIAQVLYPIILQGRLPSGKETAVAIATVIGGMLVKDHSVTGGQQDQQGNKVDSNCTPTT